ncbi:unnamed protein product [Caenorhabditis brenneri]
MSYYGNSGFTPYGQPGYAPPLVYGAPGYMPPSVHIHTEGHQHGHHHHHHGFLHETKMYGQLLRPAHETELDLSEQTSAVSPKIWLEVLRAFKSVSGLGDNRKMENDRIHRTTSSSTNFYRESNQLKFLDRNGNLYKPVIIFMDLDFNTRFVDYPCESVKNSECYQNRDSPTVTRNT